MVLIKHHYSKKILDTYTIERSEVVTFAIETAIKQQNIIASQSMIKSFFRDLFLRTAAFFPKLIVFFILHTHGITVMELLIITYIQMM